jgi:6,7-dimethyl-8-ribityllumazine synthase
MTEKKKNLSEFTPFEFSSADKKVIGIVVSEWNDRITDSLLNGAKESLLEHGVKAENIHVKYVPGSFELPLGAKWMLEQTNMDAVICIGCIIQGETRHFDFIAQAVADGIMKVGLKYSKPVIFSVLTCNNMQQAEDRAGGKHGNKGVEGAVSALKMLSLEEIISR